MSVKTARRDLEALAIAGIPVYSQAGQGRRLVADRRRPHRPQRADRGRGPHAVPGRRAVVDGDAGGQGGAAQARPGAARDVPRRRRGGGVGRRARPGRLGRHDGAPAAATSTTLQQAVVDGRPGPPRLRRPHAHARPSAWSTRWASSRRARSGTSSPTPTTGCARSALNRVRSVELTDDPVVRPPDFDLAETWRSVVETIEERRTAAKAVVRDRSGGWLSGCAAQFASSFTGARRGPTTAASTSRSARRRLERIAEQLAGWGAAARGRRAPTRSATDLARIGRELVDPLRGDGLSPRSRAHSPRRPAAI